MPTQQDKTGKMKAVILAYCKQRQISMVYYFGLVVSENANAIGYAYGEYGQFGYKLDARPASRAVALRHKKRNATGSHDHQQLLWHDFRQHRCRNRPPPRFRIRRTRQKRCRRDRGRSRSNGRIQRTNPHRLALGGAGALRATPRMGLLSGLFGGNKGTILTESPAGKKQDFLEASPYWDQSTVPNTFKCYGCKWAAAWVRRGIGRFSVLRDNGLGSPAGGHGAGQALLL